MVDEGNYQRRISSLLWFAWFLRRVSRGNALYFGCQLLHGGLAALVFEFPDCFLVDSVLDSRWVILTVIGGVEQLFNVPSYIFVDIRRLHLINHTICIRVKDFGPDSISRFDVTVNEVIHEGFRALQDSEPKGDWLGHFHVSFVHVNGHYIIIENSPLPKSGLGDQFCCLLLVVHKPNVLPIPQILHGVPKDGFQHQLEKILVEICLGSGSQSRQFVDIFFEPGPLVKLDCSMNRLRLQTS